MPAGGIFVGRQQSLLLTGPAPRVLLLHLTRTLNGGQWVRLNMEFQNAGHVSLRVPVMPRTVPVSSMCSRAIVLLSARRACSVSASGSFV